MPNEIVATKGSKNLMVRLYRTTWRITLTEYYTFQNDLNHLPPIEGKRIVLLRHRANSFAASGVEDLEQHREFQ